MNGPTKLTILRILLIPLIVLFSYFDPPWSNWASLGVFLAASITDWLDGYLARKHNLVTMFGKLLDPLADKLLVLTALLIVLDRGYIAAWIVIALIGREMAITGLRAFLAAEGIVLAASKMGKWKTTFQIISLSFLFVADASPFLAEASGYFHKIGIGAAYLALVFSLVSAYSYVSGFWSLLGEKIMAEQLKTGASTDEDNP